MSRELLVLVALGILCIILAPLYKNAKLIHSGIQPVYHETKHDTMNPKEERITIKADNPKTIVLLSDSFLPITVAGSELTSYETLKYLRERGHEVSIFVKTHKVEFYDKFPIYKYDVDDAFCRDRIINSDYVFFQMSKVEDFDLVKERKNTTVLLIHMVNSYAWLLQQKVGFPIIVVYNSHTTQDTLHSFYDNMRMIPYVNTKEFYPIRRSTENNRKVCLINCNENKGGNLLKDLAKEMKDVEFIGVKGGYMNQIVDKTNTDNLTYIENQKDIKPVFKQIGILIMPSKNETWGRTAVEAMASGVPVIHSEAPGLVECVGGAGIQCNRDDIGAWMDAINRILGDPNYREQLRQNGFRRVREIEAEQIRGRQELALKLENN